MTQWNGIHLRHILAALLLLSCTDWLQIQAADINCIKCDSESDANCILDLNKITATDKCDSAKGCFTSTDITTNKVTRGCIADAQTCNDDSNCRKCTTDKCNNHNICKKCDSASTPQCAQTDGSSVSNEICESSSSKCQTDVTKGNTVRGCASNDNEIATCIANSKTCQVCMGANCNIGIFPSNRIKCYQCDITNEKCSNVITNTEIQSLACVQYKADDACYTFASNATNIQRGCVTDTSDANKCKQPTASAACAACNTTNCNSLPYEREQRLRCVKCDSTQQKDCMWTQQANTATSCANKLPYTKQDACYTRIKDNIVTRGCLYDLEESVQSTCTATDDTTCNTCNDSDGCNNRDGGAFTCIRCRSDAISDCYDHADKLTGETCRNGVTQSSAACFTGIWNKIVIRGCMVDTDEQMAYICNDKTNPQCKQCDTANCNNVKWSGAGVLALSNALLVTVIVALWRLR